MLATRGRGRRRRADGGDQRHAVRRRDAGAADRLHGDGAAADRRRAGRSAQDQARRRWARTANRSPSPSRRDGTHLSAERRRSPQDDLVPKLHGHRRTTATTSASSCAATRPCDYGRVMEVMGLLAAAGFTHIGLVTDVAKPKPRPAIRRQRSRRARPRPARRWACAVAVLLHAAMIAATLFTWSQHALDIADETPCVPVDLVTIADQDQCRGDGAAAAGRAAQGRARPAPPTPEPRAAARRSAAQAEAPRPSRASEARRRKKAVRRPRPRPSPTQPPRRRPSSTVNDFTALLNKLTAGGQAAAERARRGRPHRPGHRRSRTR